MRIYLVIEALAPVLVPHDFAMPHRASEILIAPFLREVEFAPAAILRPQKVFVHLELYGSLFAAANMESSIHFIPFA